MEDIKVIFGFFTVFLLLIAAFGFSMFMAVMS